MVEYVTYDSLSPPRVQAAILTSCIPQWQLACLAAGGVVEQTATAGPWHAPLLRRRLMTRRWHCSSMESQHTGQLFVQPRGFMHGHGTQTEHVSVHSAAACGWPLMSAPSAARRVLRTCVSMPVACSEILQPTSAPGAWRGCCSRRPLQLRWANAQMKAPGGGGGWRWLSAPAVTLLLP